MLAIDDHVHIMPWELIKPDALKAFLKTHGAKFEWIRATTSDPDKFARYLDECGVARAVLINYVSPEVIGFDERVNEFSAWFAKTHPDRFIPFGGLDPRNANDIAGRFDRLVEMGIRGIKIHPVHSLMRPNAYTDDARYAGLATIYEKAQEHNLPVMIHTGTSIFPLARNKFGDPIFVDDLIVDFPKLRIIIAHGGRPLWMETAFFLIRRSKNVFLDISGIPPASLLRYFPRLDEIADQVMFGSDWPGPGVRDIADNLNRFNALHLSAETKQKILHDNAERLFSNE